MLLLCHLTNDDKIDELTKEIKGQRWDTITMCEMRRTQLTEALEKEVGHDSKIIWIEHKNARLMSVSLTQRKLRMHFF